MAACIVAGEAARAQSMNGLPPSAGGEDVSGSPGVKTPLAASYSTLLPPTGTDVRLDGLGRDAESVLATGPTRPPGLTLVPSLGLGELFNDNVYQSGTDRRPDLATVVSPGLELQSNTRRLQADIGYVANAQIYTRTPGQNDVDNELNGSALATLVPGLAFVDLRAFASQQSTSGGYAPGGTIATTAQNRTNTSSFEVSPYLAHQFGTYGTGELGYRFSYTTQNGALPYGSANPVVPLTSSNLGLDQNLATNEEFASYTTGPDLGRAFDGVLADTSQYSGSGVLAMAHRSVFVDTFEYAVTRSVAPQLQLGYEDLAYSGQPPIRISDAIWSAGVKLTPNEGSEVLVRYGHHDGFDSLYVDGGYQVTARTKLFATYSEGLTSGAQQVQQYLAASTTGAGGVAVSQMTGAPLLLTNGFFGQQDQLYRETIASATSLTVYARDSLSVSVLHEDDRLVAADGLSTGSYSQSGTTGSVTWTHQITPRLTGTAYVQYGDRSLAGSAASEQNVLTVATSATYALGPGLAATAEYTFTNQGSSVGGQGFLQNIILVGLRKTF